MSINWLVTVPTPQGVTIPTYGNYGGTNYSDGRIVQPNEITPLTTPPVDALDALFREHDRAYSTSSDPLVLAQADLQLLRGIANLSDAQLSGEGQLYAGAAELGLIEQIKVRWGHAELFSPGEESILRADAINNIEEGSVDPEFNEIGAVASQVSNLLQYARAAGLPVSTIDLADSHILVDDNYYLANNADILLAGVDPDQHYAAFGWREGRNPNALFDTKAYLAAYRDVAGADLNPLEHYEQWGWKEGRDPSGLFDTTSYLSAYPDVALAGINPLEHFLKFGIAEGRSGFGDGAIG